jgi:hypothetical protein
MQVANVHGRRTHHPCLQHGTEAEARDRSRCHPMQAREEVATGQQGGCEPEVSRRQGLEAATCGHTQLDLVNGIAHLVGWAEACHIEAAAGDTAVEGHIGAV